MPLNAKVSGVWKDITSVHVNVGNVWKTVLSAWVKVSGVWEQVYANLSAAITGDLENNNDSVPGSVSISLGLSVEGAGPFSYLWSYTGSPTSVGTVTNPVFSITFTSASADSRSGTVQCAVTDAYGNTVITPPQLWSLTLGLI